MVPQQYIAYDTLDCGSVQMDTNNTHKLPQRYPMQWSHSRDPFVTAEATVSHSGLLHRLQKYNSKQSSPQYETDGDAVVQEMLTPLDSADHSVSHSLNRNAAVLEDILCFTVKARLQVLPTKYNLACVMGP